jgi:Fimbrial assembly protein (PilN)
MGGTMTTTINLMSLHARRRECSRTRIRQWSTAVGALCGVLALLSLERYVAYRTISERQFALQNKYDPIAELKTANQILAKQIAAIRGEEQFVLALSEREPTITILGLLGKAVSEADQRIFLQKLELFNQSLEVGSPVAKKIVLDMAGIANSGSAVNQFADKLRQSLSFGKVEITSAKEYQVKQQTMHDFSLQMNFE